MATINLTRSQFPRFPGVSQTVTFAFVGIFCGALGLRAQTAVLTYHNDNGRTGLNASETILTPANVNSASFGKLATFPVDGQVYAQPLYIPNVPVAGAGTRNVVLVVTEHDSVYLFDAAAAGNTAPLWSISFLSGGATTFPSVDAFGCGQITPEIGITATPVIDPATNTAYIVAATKLPGAPPHYVQTLHAISLTDHSEKFGGPKVIGETINNNGNYTYVSGPSVNGTGTGSVGGVLTFNAFTHKSRPGLALANNTVYTFWSSHCDVDPSHGWVLGFDAATLQAKAVLNTTPNGSLATIWNSGGGPPVDAAGNLYVLPGNGTFETSLDVSGFPSQADFGDGFMRLVPDPNSSAGNQNANGWGLKVADYFVPFNHTDLSNRDIDVGSGGLVLLPASAGSTAHPSLLVAAGKEGRIYLVDASNMGHFNSVSDNIVQELPGAVNFSFGTPAYFNNTLYYGAANDFLKAFSVNNATIGAGPTSQSTGTFVYSGLTPSVSANGTTNGVVWAIQNEGGAAVLDAFDAANLAHQLYDSSTTNGRDTPGTFVKFTVPTIASGRVFVGTGANVTAFGLLAPPCAPDVSSQVSVTRGGFTYDYRTTHFFQRVTLTNTGAGSVSGPLSLVLSSLSSGVSLVGSAGTTTCGGTAGSTYTNADLTGTGGSLAAGGSVVISLEFADPAKTAIRYSTGVVAGQGSR